MSEQSNRWVDVWMNPRGLEKYVIQHRYISSEVCHLHVVHRTRKIMSSSRGQTFSCQLLDLIFSKFSSLQHDPLLQSCSSHQLTLPSSFRLASPVSAIPHPQTHRLPSSQQPFSLSITLCSHLPRPGSYSSHWVGLPSGFSNSPLDSKPVKWIGLLCYLCLKPPHVQHGTYRKSNYVGIGVISALMSASPTTV